MTRQETSANIGRQPFYCMEDKMTSAGYRVIANLGFIAAGTILIFSQTTHKVELAERVELSDQVQQRVKAKLAQSSDQDVYVFDREGAVTKSFKLSKAATTPQSIPILLKSSASPVKDCKKPVPTPPPGCVVCESGKFVCSKKLQDPQKKDPSR